jgi:hypothetical protein
MLLCALLLSKLGKPVLARGLTVLSILASLMAQYSLHWQWQLLDLHPCMYIAMKQSNKGLGMIEIFHVLLPKISSKIALALA